MDNSTVRIVQALHAEAARLPAGARLPSVRALVASLRVSPLTVRAAFARLAAEGVIDARPGQGTFVAPRRSGPGNAGDLGWQSVALGAARADTSADEELTALPPPGRVSLSGGYLPADFQAARELGRILARVAACADAWDRLPPEGLDPLRAWFAQAAGGAFTARDVLICPGSRPAIAAVMRGLAAPGDAVAMESPTYLGAITTAKAAGLRVVPVATDAEGVRPDLLADALATSGARVFYCQPMHANPSGATLGAARRTEVLNVMRAARAFLIEDDWARDLHFGDRPPPAPLAAADPDGHVVYIRSLTKPAAPGLRVAALCARGAAFARLRSARSAEDIQVASPLQMAAAELVASAAWPRHLRRLHTALRARCDVLADAIRAGLGAAALAGVPGGGLHMWIRLPDNVAEAEIVAGCARSDVIVSAGRVWFPAEPPGPHLRLSFAGADPATLVHCTAVLAEVVKHIAG